MNPCFAGGNPRTSKFNIFHNDKRAIKSLLKKQVKYANRTNFNKFIATYDNDYMNYDGFDLLTYSDIIKEVWSHYDNIVYNMKINDIVVHDDFTATVEVTENSYAEIPSDSKLNGKLKSDSSSKYYLRKINGRWKVFSDEVLSEETSMMYGDANDLEIKLTAPKEVPAGAEYTATLEFSPPENTIAIASIAKDTVEYPQKQPVEVFRKFPEDEILERLFVSNRNNMNEYVVASIGLTRADVENFSVKLSLSGYGYKIVRVNVTPSVDEDDSDKD